METSPAIDGDALRDARERAGLSQDELARRVGLSSGQRVSRWERGEARPRTPGLLHATAAALGVPATTLLVPATAGPSLRWLRFAAGLSVEDVAEATHTSVSSVKRWEAHGLRAPAPSAVHALAHALGASPQQVQVALRP